MGVFPMNAPRYAVYMMLDEPHATKATYGYATAGWVSAPAAGKVIARIGPVLGLLPETDNVPAINAQLAQPLEPGRPAGAKPVAAVPPPPAKASPPVAGLPRPSIPTAAQPGAPAATAPRDMRREANAIPAARGEVTTVAARREAGTQFSGAAIAVR